MTIHLNDISHIDYNVRVATNKVPGAKPIIRFGTTESVGNNDFFNIHPLGGASAYRLSASRIDINGNDINDTLLGTGVRRIRIKGLDVNFSPIEEVVDMDGTNVVTTVNSFLRLNSIESEEVGSDGSANNRIVGIYESAPTSVAFTIETGDNQFELVRYSIPADKIGILRKLTVTNVTAQRVTLRVKTRQNLPSQTPFITIFKTETNNTSLEFDLSGFEQLPGGTDVDIDVIAPDGAGSETITAAISLIEQNPT